MQRKFTSSQVFSFKEGLSEKLVKDFLRFASEVPLFDRNLIIIDVQCGTRSLLAYQAFIGFTDLYAKGSSVHTHGGIFVSGYLKLFLLGKYRTITPDSRGMIHLPVKMEGHKLMKGVESDKLEIMRQETAEFIAKRTNLSVADVFLLNEKRLVPEQMLELGIAHEVIPSLQTLITR
ncbi:MAG: hypothetical protein JWM20_616 [Patescibacteria group bacterium]|nr:hypothetical protein [Patescibacteria group bacterium]